MNCTLPGIYFVPFPGNCSLYMVCSNFELQKEVQMCVPGTLFDPDVGQCNLEASVHCRPICPPSGVIKLPHFNNCTLYWTCVNGEAALQACVPDFYFDQFNGECNVAELVMCPNICPPTGIINFPHANCTLYWTFVNGGASLHSCAPQLLFDRSLGQCNLPEYVICEDPNINEHKMEHGFKTGSHSVSYQHVMSKILQENLS